MLKSCGASGEDGYGMSDSDSEQEAHHTQDRWRYSPGGGRFLGQGASGELSVSGDFWRLWCDTIFGRGRTQRRMQICADWGVPVLERHWFWNQIFWYVLLMFGLVCHDDWWSQYQTEHCWGFAALKNHIYIYILYYIYIYYIYYINICYIYIIYISRLSRMPTHDKYLKDAEVHQYQTQPEAAAKKCMKWWDVPWISPSAVSTMVIHLYCVWNYTYCNNANVCW